jgi:glutamyl-tRNA synthetase/glutamyl-Q tRNA(Asp) synthetase
VKASIPAGRTLTRFAPAPTGYLHLGHVASALYVWNLGRAAGARVLLRIDDHDRQRCRPEYERALLDDLDWLGFAADVFPTSAFRAGRSDGRQSDRGAIYAAAARQLAGSGLVYACACTRQDLARQRPADRAPDFYPGTCRHRALPLAPRGVVWRVAIDDTVETFDDGLLGPQVQRPAIQSGDVAIRDRLGNWTYQFVTAVDDFRMGIDLVVRGRDLLESTGRQIVIARLLGRATPAAYAHHPLIMKTPAQKLSKSDGDTAVGELRAAGWTAAAVIAEAARLVGLPDGGADAAGGFARGLS